MLLTRRHVVTHFFFPDGEAFPVSLTPAVLSLPWCYISGLREGGGEGDMVRGGVMVDRQG